MVSPKKSSLNDTRLDGIVCCMQQESIEISVEVWPSFQKDWFNLIWSMFSENGTAADAFTEAPIYNPVLPLVLK